MKNILILGSSAGMGIEKSFKEVFPNIQDSNITNLSGNGAGNFYIAGRLFEYISHNKKPDYIFFKFTGLNRWDLPFDQKVSLDDYQYQTNSKLTKWVFSGGYSGSWLTNNILKKIFCYIYDVKDQNKTNNQSMQQIFSCISLCETLKINYNWTFYYDITNPPSKSSGEDGFIEKLPSYISTKKMLDFTPLNYSYDINEAPEDGNHYDKSTFTKNLKEKKIYNKIKESLK